jgi:hypothetical protein
VAAFLSAKASSDIKACGLSNAAVKCFILLLRALHQFYKLKSTYYIHWYLPSR